VRRPRSQQTPGWGFCVFALGSQLRSVTAVYADEGPWRRRLRASRVMRAVVEPHRPSARGSQRRNTSLYDNIAGANVVPMLATSSSTGSACHIGYGRGL
jgi:hypothetical protein